FSGITPVVTIPKSSGISTLTKSFKEASGWQPSAQARSFAKGKARTPRAPITELTFKLMGDPEPIPVNLVGTPNKDNGVRGTLDLGQATKLFYSLSNEQEIEALLKYGDGTSDLLAFAGIR